MADTDDNAEAVGTGNDARVAMLGRINDANDGLRADELADINDDGTTSDYVAPDLTPSDDDGVTAAELARAEAEVADEPAAPAAEPRYKIKVNGKELELSASELIARAQKVEAADQYLNEAAQLRRQAIEQVTPPVPSVEDARAKAVEDRRALVRAIQMGSEDEAMAALEQLQNAGRQPQLSQDDLARTVDERLTFKEAVSRFETEYKDILSDPELRAMALQKDQQALASGDKRAYWERYSAIGNEVRAWRDNIVKQSAPAPAVPASKQTAKADASRRAAPSSAATKSAAAAPAEESDESISDIIANIAKARGGPQWTRA